jgi:hypothetical protein
LGKTIKFKETINSKFIREGLKAKKLARSVNLAISASGKVYREFLYTKRAPQPLHFNSSILSKMIEASY